MASTNRKRPAPLMFEHSTSTLYYSNDARLHVEKEPSPDSFKDDGPLVALPAYIYRIVRLAEGQTWHDGSEPETVFCTFDRVKADAYVAGYDLAIDQQLSKHQRETMELRQAAKALGIDLDAPRSRS